eukprot:scaffold1333_cov42-Phaeocystis_antarctica.AAC.1
MSPPSSAGPKSDDTARFFLVGLGGMVIASERRASASYQTTESAPGVAAKLLRMRRLAILSHTLRGGISRVQLLALQGHNHTSERVTKGGHAGWTQLLPWPAAVLVGP